MKKISNNQINEFLEKVSLLFNSGRTTRSLNLLDKEIRNNPNNIDLLKKGIQLYRLIGNYKSSITFSLKLIKNNPRSKNEYIKIAQDYEHIKEIEQARKILQDGLAIFPKDEKLLKHYSEINCRYELFDDAILTAFKAFKNTTEDWPLAILKMFLGNKIINGEKETAKKLIQLWLEVEKYTEKIFEIATESFFNISDLSNSSIYSEQLINKFPNNPKGYVFIIRSKISINELKEAILFCERGLEVIPDNFDMLSLKSDIYRKLGDWEESCNISSKLLEKHPIWSSKNRLIQDYLELKDEKKAKELIENKKIDCNQEVSIFHYDSCHSKSWMNYIKEFILKRLYHNNEPGYFTSIAGPTNAKYQSCTNLHLHIYENIFYLLNFYKIRYFVFAGALVGYVRNKSFPKWMEDMDIMIFEEDQQIFETLLVPILQSIGLTVMRPANPGASYGGFHILGLNNQSEGKSRFSVPNIFYEDGQLIKFPRLQIDVFFSKTVFGLVKNNAGWGLYNKKMVKESWVKPSKQIKISNLDIPSFNNPYRDVQEEYGDVMNNIVVSNHGTNYLRVENMSWSTFEQIIEDYENNLNFYPNGISKQKIESFEHLNTLTISENISFCKICNSIIEGNIGTLNLEIRESIFWCMDLKRLFSNLKIRVEISDILTLNLAIIFDKFIDEVKFSGPDWLRSSYERKRLMAFPNEYKIESKLLPRFIN